MPETDPRARENLLLRLVDWRFLLRLEGTPRALVLLSGDLADALALVTEPTEDGEGAADLAVIDAPTEANLVAARRALRPGGQLACVWPRPGWTSVRGLRKKLTEAGFSAPRLHTFGPAYAETPAYWLPLDSAAAMRHVFSQRPPRSMRERLNRRLNWIAWSIGYAAPAIAIASVSDTSPRVPPDEDALSGTAPWALLTHGDSVDSAVAGLPFPDGARRPEVVAKVGRTSASDGALEREAELLLRLQRDRPTLSGVPWTRTRGHRAGRSVIVQNALDGVPLERSLKPSTFDRIALEMTDWLIELAGMPVPEPMTSWGGRLVDGPIAALPTIGHAPQARDLATRARAALSDLPDLPLVWEHRDLGHWNVVVPDAGGFAVFDWEFAEPRGLPALDLTWFLVSSALSIDGEAGGGLDRTRTVARYERLLDPDTAIGGAIAAAIGKYASTLGVGLDLLPRLRLLCWIVLAVNLDEHQPERPNIFLDFMAFELDRIEAAS